MKRPVKRLLNIWSLPVVFERFRSGLDKDELRVDDAIIIESSTSLNLFVGLSIIININYLS